MTKAEVRKDATGAYIVVDGERELAELRPVDDNWFQARRLPSGALRTMYQPHNGSDEDELRAAKAVVVRLF